MSDKVITVNTRSGVRQVLYKEKVMGTIFPDSTDEEISNVFEACLDELLERQERRLAKELPEKLTPMLEKFMEQCYKAGYSRQQPPKGLLSQIVKILL